METYWASVWVIVIVIAGLSSSWTAEASTASALQNIVIFIFQIVFKFVMIKEISASGSSEFQIAAYKELTLKLLDLSQIVII